MKKLNYLIFGFMVSGAHATDYPTMEGVWGGTLRTVSSGEEVSTQGPEVAR